MNITTIANQFVRAEYTDQIMYTELANIETNAEFKKILRELVEHEKHDVAFWKKHASNKTCRVSPFTIAGVKLMRRILGLTFTAKFIERNEKRAIRAYKEFAEIADKDLKKHVENIIAHEQQHEAAMIEKIDEERVAFVGSIILGLNDGLIELTGALVGFSFVFASTAVVALTGSITGIAAVCSMAASAYQQARHEKDGQPAKAALYTGGAYLIVVIALLLPFILLSSTASALMAMFAVILVIVAGVSFYTAVLFDRDFYKQFAEMLVFSVGVAIVTFAIGTAFRSFTGITI